MHQTHKLGHRRRTREAQKYYHIRVCVCVNKCVCIWNKRTSGHFDVLNHMHLRAHIHTNTHRALRAFDAFNTHTHTHTHSRAHTRKLQTYRENIQCLANFWIVVHKQWLQLCCKIQEMWSQFISDSACIRVSACLDIEVMY
jgi:hypothetical protein